MCRRNMAMIRRQPRRTRRKKIKSRPRLRNREKLMSNRDLKKGKNTGANKHKSKASSKVKYGSVKRPNKKQLNSSGKQEHSDLLRRLPPCLRRGYRSTLTNFCRITLSTSERPVCRACVSVLDAANV